MRHIRRELERQLLKAARSFPAVVLTGPRRAGKTWLLRRQRLRDAVRKNRREETAVNMFLVHQAPTVKSGTEAVAPGVRALAWRDFVEEM